MLVFYSKLSAPNRNILRHIELRFAEEPLTYDMFRAFVYVEAGQMMKYALECVSKLSALETLTILSGSIITSAHMETFDYINKHRGSSKMIIVIDTPKNYGFGNPTLEQSIPRIDLHYMQRFLDWGWEVQREFGPVNDRSRKRLQLEDLECA